MEVGVKESSKKKLVRSTWDGHVAKMGDEKRDQMPSKWRGNGGEKEDHRLRWGLHWKEWEKNGKQ